MRSSNRDAKHSRIFSILTTVMVTSVMLLLYHVMVYGEASFVPNSLGAHSTLSSKSHNSLQHKGTPSRRPETPMGDNDSEITFSAWDGVSVRTGSTPWRQQCDFMTTRRIQQYLNVPDFELCLRKPDLKDYMSDFIRREGRWKDCDELVDMWREEQLSSARGVFTTPNGTIVSEIFVDIGSNVGTCTMLLASMGAHVVAFEPLPANLYYLESGILANDGFRERITLFPIGLGESRSLHLIYTETANAGNAVIDEPIKASPKDPVEVTVIPLDDVLWPDRSVPPPRIPVLKVDAEGYEMHILKGARALLASGAIGRIKSEVATRWLQGLGSSATEYLTSLRALGFDLFLRNGSVLNDDLMKRWDEENVVTDIIANFRRKQ